MASCEKNISYAKDVCTVLSPVLFDDTEFNAIRDITKKKTASNNIAIKHYCK